MTDGLVALALEQRQAARARKDFAAADAIRDQLTSPRRLRRGHPAGTPMGAEPLMAGNSQRRGRTTGAGKKTATAGTGGKNRRSLAGRGATPPAEARPGHPAQRRAAADQRQRADRARARARAEETPELLLGRNPVVEALRAKIPATALYVVTGDNQRTSDERIAEAMALAADRGLPLLEVGKAEFDRMSQGALHQGIGLQVPPYDYAHPDDLLDLARNSGRPPLIVALDGVTDPRNLGAVVRSAAAFDAHGVVVPQRRAVGMTASAWRTSAGAAARIPVARAVNLARALASYQDAGLQTVGLAGDGDVDLRRVRRVRRPGGARRRRRGHRAVPAGAGALRRRRPHPDRPRHRVAQRQRRRRHRPLRRRPPPAADPPDRDREPGAVLPRRARAARCGEPSGRSGRRDRRQPSSWATV